MDLERDSRRPDFDPESIPIRLADGREWYFPPPRMMLRVHVAEDGSFACRPCAKGGTADWGEVLERLDGAADPLERFAAIASLAVQLLRRNYSIPDAMVPGLFAWDPDDDESMETWAELARLVRGVAPKASPAGSGSPA